MDTLNSLGERQQSLLRLLLGRPDGLTQDQLAGHLQISRNAVQQHVQMLTRQGFLSARVLPSRGGRPSQAHTMTDAGRNLFPRQYGLFASLLMQTLDGRLTGSEMDALLVQIGEGMADSVRERVLKSDDQITEVRLIMSELGYETRQPQNASEARQITADNCVFHDLAMFNDRVCQLDVALLERLLDAPVTQTECMARGGSHCTFCIGQVRRGK